MLQQSITSQSLNRVDPHTSVVPIIDPSRPRTKVYKVPDRPALPTPPFISPEEYESQYSTESVPIVIDNGSCSIRAGYGSMSSPYIDTDSVVSRYRDRKTNRTIMLAGTCSYVDTNSRSNARPLHEEGVVCNYDTMEVMLDYVFLNLGVNADTVQHPILMSEALCNPVYTRGLMSELLFETYQTPSVCYGVDSLFSYHETHYEIPQSQQTSLVISSSHSSTTIIPVIAGIPHIAQSRRLNWGGLQESEFLLRLMQVKYSTFPSRMTPFQAFDLVQDHCLFSADAFQEDIRNSTIPIFWLKLIESSIPIHPGSQKKVKRNIKKRLSMEGFDNEEELETLLKKTQLQLKKARNKDLGIDEEAEKGEPSFPLVDTPDHQLDEEGLKEKRRQKLMKAGHDAAEIERRDEEERLSNPNAWLAKVRTQYENLLVKIKERKKRRIQLSDRKSLAAQQRMKTIANLASDQPPGKTVNGNKKRKKTNDDTFGADDADWAVYRDVVGADESADEEDDLLELITVEKQLLEHDELFTIEDTRERQKLKRHCLMNAFYKGISPSKDDSSTIMAALDTEGNAEQSARLHINIERIRVPEPLYQPLLAGVDQAGLVEVVQYVLKEFSQDVQDQLTQVSPYYLTGGHITLPNFDVRLWNSLRPILPMNSPCNIFRPNLSNQEIRLLPWKGMAKFSSSPEFLQASITKQAYLECGNEYLMEHRFSNKLNF
ncbi:hypothetical protein PSTT_05228 [Puccinia striiformis]|uniref:Actin-related protein 5 n=1 Tax=Puccinia striiformis TaxID=27350 RepID=A0A2S4VQ21_9BASI|nr:hypothetical protein PSTT_05228 [Puccinia striiformis]